MRWFEGDISAAVAKSKSEKAVFVVFVEGLYNVVRLRFFYDEPHFHWHLCIRVYICTPKSKVL
jgi:hypothetical protein